MRVRGGFRSGRALAAATLAALVCLAAEALAKAALGSEASAKAALSDEGTAQTTEEVRALWVLRTSLTSPDRITALVRTARDHGFNTLLVQVRGRGDAYYTASVEPRAPELAAAPAPIAMNASTVFQAIVAQTSSRARRRRDTAGWSLVVVLMARQRTVRISRRSREVFEPLPVLLGGQLATGVALLEDLFGP